MIGKADEARLPTFAEETPTFHRHRCNMRSARNHVNITHLPIPLTLIHSLSTKDIWGNHAVFLQHKAIENTLFTLVSVLLLFAIHALLQWKKLSRPKDKYQIRTDEPCCRLARICQLSTLQPAASHTKYTCIVRQAAKLTLRHEPA